MFFKAGSLMVKDTGLRRDADLCFGLWALKSYEISYVKPVTDMVLEVLEVLVFNVHGRIRIP